ncbi:hypothetical protein [Candidatus Mycoplasma haematohominis]|uniref:hypothetical protein n=1 Tax=Candidatus Mycoplasma haematohominis TaxID=1494318 RepID=UPI001FE9F887|nr:hypothetical protein [Candidatus Mycoplasma haemohominis]
MAEKKENQLWLRVATIQGIVYEDYVKFVQVKKHNGLMIINRNYSSVMEQLADGEIVVHEKSNKVVIDVKDSCLSVNDNRCNIYGTEAKIVGK